MTRGEVPGGGETGGETAFDLTPQEEAVRIYEAIFRAPPSDTTVERFVAASNELSNAVPPEAVRSYYEAVTATADLEALELASRYTKRLPLLVAKFRLMVYLAETVPENQAHFVNERDPRGRAFIALALGAVVTLFKLGKGLLLLRKRRG